MSASVVTVVPVVTATPTIAVLMKEAMVNMPDILNTKKEIDEYFKIAIKEIMTKKKEEEKATKPKRLAKPAVKKPTKDEDIDSSEDASVPNVKSVKAVKPPSKRKIFYDEMRIKIKDMFPDLNSVKTKKKIDELWKVHMDEEFAYKPM